MTEPLHAAISRDLGAALERIAALEVELAAVTEKWAVALAERDEARALLAVQEDDGA